MFKYVMKKIGFMLLTLTIIMVITFVLVKSAPEELLHPPISIG